MKKGLLVNLLGMVLLSVAGIAHADFVFRATLTSDQEFPITPPPQGTGGSATFVLNSAMTRLTYDVTFFGLDMRGINTSTGVTESGAPGQPAIPGDLNSNDNFTRLHIHVAAPGASGGIVFGMIDLPGAATINDVNPDDLTIDIVNLHVTGAWDAAEGASGQTLTSQLSNLFNGLLYINVHTFDFASGEIRGQILAVPEPTSLALFGIGLVGVLGAALRRRRRV